MYRSEQLKLTDEIDPSYFARPYINDIGFDFVRESKLKHNHENHIDKIA